MHALHPCGSGDPAKAGTGITPSNQPNTSCGTLPFGAMLGQCILFVFHQPARFSQVAAKFDVPAYLSSLEEYAMLTGTAGDAGVLWVPLSERRTHKCCGMLIHCRLLQKDQ